LIVVVIIGIIAAIAIPNLLAARRSANEGSAIAAMRTLHGGQMTYSSTYGNGNFAGTASGTADVVALTQLGGAFVIDTAMTSGSKSGFNFRGGRATSSSTTPATFFFTANPVSTTALIATGSRRFGIATDGVIKADAASANLGTQFTDTTVSSAAALVN
jgi:type II secretory pathway pseudopilin PulG